MNHLQIIQDKFIVKVLATIFGARCKPLYIKGLAPCTDGHLVAQIM